MTLSCHAHRCAFSITMIALMQAGAQAQAQQFEADGVSLVAPAGVYDTGPAVGSAGYAFWAVNGGSIVNGGFVELITSGNNAPAAVAQGAASSIIITDGTITTSGIGAHGAYARSNASIMLQNGVVITTQADYADGLRADLRGNISSIGSTIITHGLGTAGAIAGGDGSITIDGGTISTTGDAGYGVNSFGIITLQNGVQISTQGEFGNGVHADGGTVIVHGGTIRTTGVSAHAAMSWYSGGNITLNAVQIITEGSAAHALNASSGGTVIVNGGTVSTTGMNAFGVESLASSSFTLYGVQIDTHGVNAAGLADSNGTITLDQSIVSTTGANAAAVVLSGSSVSITGSTLTTSGADADVVHSAHDSTITITGSTLSASDGAGIAVTGRILNAAVTNSTITGGDELLDVDGGALQLNATVSSLTGSAFTQNGTSHLNLQATNWTVTGDSNVTDLTNGAGSLIHFTPPGSEAGPFKTLTTRNYVGQGGTLGINTHLGADGAPSDKLHIYGGTATGSSLLAVNNVGGAGDLTTLDGILVVDMLNGGTTVPGLFTLAGPVVAGPYEYSLYRCGENGANPDNWYLRSDLDCSLDPSAVICGGGGDDIPDWRQETSLYAAVPAMTLFYGRLMLDTLHERRGTAVSAYAEGAPNAAWARVIGQHGDRDGGKGGIYGAGPKYDYDFWAFQATVTNSSVTVGDQLMDVIGTLNLNATGSTLIGSALKTVSSVSNLCSRRIGPSPAIPM